MRKTRFDLSICNILTTIVKGARGGIAGGRPTMAGRKLKLPGYPVSKSPRAALA